MTYAIILSGGIGTRIGLEIPKQYYQVDNKPIIQYGLEIIESVKSIKGYIVVAEEEWHQYVYDILGQDSKFIEFAEPGKNRQLSIYNGLLKLKKYVEEDDLVLVQDAARPNTTIELIQRCIDGIKPEEDGIMPVLRMKDTVYLSENGLMIDSLLKRENVFAGQAPEVFRFKKYLEANERLLPKEILGINGSTEPAVMYGMKIGLIEGDENNYKITTMSDLQRFERWIEEKQR